MSVSARDNATQTPLAIVAGFWPALDRSRHTAFVSTTGEPSVVVQFLQESRAPWLVIVQLEDVLAEALRASATKSFAGAVKVAILNSVDNVDLADRWLHRGVRVYLGADTEPERVASILRASSDLDAVVIDRRVQASAIALGAEASLALSPSGRPLSDLDKEILRLVGVGLTNSAIAVELNVAERTVESHLTSIFRRLGVVSRLEAAARARRLGL
jgi:DNA-binding NarL/FixJ family response regulator